MSVPKRVSAMGPDGTELNLDGISKPELEKIPEARAKELTGNRFDCSVCRLGISGRGLSENSDLESRSTERTIAHPYRKCDWNKYNF